MQSRVCFLECEADALENGRPKVGFSATIRRSHDELRDNNYICNFLNTRERLKRPQQEGASVDQRGMEEVLFKTLSYIPGRLKYPTGQTQSKISRFSNPNTLIPLPPTQPYPSI